MRASCLERWDLFGPTAVATYAVQLPGPWAPCPVRFVGVPPQRIIQGRFLRASCRKCWHLLSIQTHERTHTHKHKHMRVHTCTRSRAKATTQTRTSDCRDRCTVYNIGTERIRPEVSVSGFVFVLSVSGLVAKVMALPSLLTYFFIKNELGVSSRLPHTLCLHQIWSKWTYPASKWPYPASNERIRPCWASWIRSLSRKVNWAYPASHFFTHMSRRLELESCFCTRAEYAQSHRPHTLRSEGLGRILGSLEIHEFLKN